MNVPYLTVCILCAFLGIAFLYRFCLVFRSSREGYETGACKTIGSREIQMDYFTIEENERAAELLLRQSFGFLKKFLKRTTWQTTRPIFLRKRFRRQTGKF